MERTGPKLCCSSKIPVHGKWLSSESWKFLILVRAIHVQFCFAFVEKKNYTEIWAQKGFVTTCFEKRCLKLWKVCMEFLFCTQIQKSAKQTPWLQERQRSLSSKKQSRSTWETPAAHWENMPSLQTTFNYPSDRAERHRVTSMWGKTWLQKSWLLISVTQLLTPSLKTSSLKTSCF